MVKVWLIRYIIMVKRKTEDIKEYMKHYKSKDLFKRRRKENLKYYKCECGGKYDSEHVKRHMQSKRHQKYNNKVLLEIVDELWEMDMFISQCSEKILDDLDKVDEGCFFDEEPLEIDINDDFEVTSDFEDIDDYNDIFW